MYGVYGFLEDHLGCRWFAPASAAFPSPPRLAVAPIDERQAPALEYRELYLDDCFNADWCARNRLNSTFESSTIGTAARSPFAKGFFVHTFNRLVPPEKYFDQASRVFFADPRPAAEKTFAALLHESRRDPPMHRGDSRGHARATAGHRVSVSQNDWDGHCECPACQALASARTRKSPRCCNWSTAWRKRSRRSSPTRSSTPWPTSGPAARRKPSARGGTSSFACAPSSAAFRIPWKRATAARIARLRRPGGLEQGRPAALGLGLRHRFPQLSAAVSQSARARAERPLLRCPQRERNLRARHLQHAAKRACRPGRIHHGQVSLESQVRHNRATGEFLPATTAVRPRPSASTSTCCTTASSARTSTSLSRPNATVPTCPTNCWSRPIAYGNRRRTSWRPNRRFCSA